MGSACLISPDKITQLPEKANKDFYFIIPPAFEGLISVNDSANYNSTTLSICRNHDEFYELMHQASPFAHIIYLPATDHKNFFKFNKEDLLPNQSAIVFNVTRFPQDWQAIKKYLPLIENTDIDAQIKSAEYFFEGINKESTLHLKDFNYHTTATFEVDDNCQFNELYGYVRDQQIETVVPSGEIAITSDDPFNIAPKPISLNGQLCLQSYPLILLGGIDPYVREKDQQRLYKNLTSLVNHPIIATVKNGIITNLVPANNHSDRTALNTLSSLIEVDERYAILTEIGIGLNTQCPIELYNCGLMEIYGRNNYCVHYGFGNHNTNYHIDLICPSTKLIVRDELLNP